jgi:hypothetical protein
VVRYWVVRSAVHRDHRVLLFGCDLYAHVAPEHERAVSADRSMNHDGYFRWLERIEQELADKREAALNAELRALPVTDVEIAENRMAMRTMYEQKGMSIPEAHRAADDLLQECLTFHIFGPHFEIKDDDDDDS